MKIERGIEKKTVTWAGGTDSTPISIEGINAMMSIVLPAAFSGTKLSYKVPDGAGGWTPLYSGGTLVETAVTNPGCNVLDSALFAVDQVKFVSDASETLTDVVVNCVS